MKILVIDGYYYLITKDHHYQSLVIPHDELHQWLVDTCCPAMISSEDEIDCCIDGSDWSQYEQLFNMS